MESHDTLEVLRAVGAALAVFVPLVVFWLQKKDKLQKTKYFVELMRAHEELKTIRRHQETENASPVVMEKIDSLLREVDEEINFTTMDRSAIRLFMTWVFLECVILSLIFSQWSEYINKVFAGPSYESGLYFLEGIFQSTTARLIMLMVFVSISVFFSIKKIKPRTDRLPTAFKRHVALFAAFNGILILVTIVICFVLWALDPIVPYW